MKNLFELRSLNSSTRHSVVPWDLCRMHESAHISVPHVRELLSTERPFRTDPPRWPSVFPFPGDNRTAFGACKLHIHKCGRRRSRVSHCIGVAFGVGPDESVCHAPVSRYRRPGRPWLYTGPSDVPPPSSAIRQSLYCKATVVGKGFTHAFHD